MLTTKLKIKGMHCASCKALVESVCRDVQGVQSCDVDVETGVATIIHDEIFEIERIKKGIIELGDNYSVEEIV